MTASRKDPINNNPAIKKSIGITNPKDPSYTNRKDLQLNVETTTK